MRFLAAILPHIKLLREVSYIHREDVDSGVKIQKQIEHSLPRVPRNGGPYFGWIISLLALLADDSSFAPPFICPPTEHAPSSPNGLPTTIGRSTAGY